MTDWRIASSSTPICSTSSGVRCPIGLWVFFCRTVMVTPLVRGSGGLWNRSVVDDAGAGGCGDAGLDRDALALGLAGGGGRDGSGAQVAHGSLAQGQDAAEADAHAAPGRHEDAGGLGGVEDGGGAVGVDGRARAGEVDRAALADDEGRGAELLGEQVEPALVVVALERIEQATGTARERRPVEQVGDEGLEVGDVEDTVLVVVAGDETDEP